METKRRTKLKMGEILKTLLFLSIVVSITNCSKDDGPVRPDPDPITKEPEPTPEQKSSEKQMISFRFTGIEKDGVTVDVPGQIDQATKTIVAEMPQGTDIASMEPELEISDKATYEPSGPQDFTGPVNYTVTAEDGTSRTYLVTVAVALSQKEILLLISQANPNNTLDWDENDNISDWEEVVLDGEGKVVELHLGLSALTALPPEIGQLANLEVLGLNNNDLGTLPPEIGQLANLEQLWLTANDLGALPPEIWQLANLERLYLENNNLGALPPEIRQLANLEVLWLDNIDLGALPPEIGQLANLERLYLENNGLGALPTEIGQLANLEWLYLRFNDLGAVPPEIGQLANLELLLLAGNPDLDAIPATVCALDTSLGGNTDVDIVPGVTCTFTITSSLK